MLEFIICSSVTILPDYLIRRYGQGKRWGHEITLFSMWYELRWGITACLMLTVSLITLIFYYHPSTTNVRSFFRTVTIVSEKVGRVAEVHVENYQLVNRGDPIYTLDDSRERAAVRTAERRVAEVEARAEVAKAELAAAVGTKDQAEGAYTQALEELQTRQALALRGGDSIVSQREVDRLRNTTDSRKGALDAAVAAMAAAEARLEVQIPAERETARSALAEAEADLAKTRIVGGIDGRVEQFVLKPGDISNPVLRPAGILVPIGAEVDGSGVERFQAGFGQLTAEIIEPGMLGEITCATKAFTIIPMVVTNVQDVIAAGQFRPTDQLMDVSQARPGGTITVELEPLYPGQALDIPPGSQCIANVYTNNHALLEEGDLSTGAYVFYHVVDTVGLVHAFILRAQALLFPVRTLVLSGH